MIVNLSWTTMKSAIDTNTTINFFWNQENEYFSNSSDPNCERYFIRQTIGNDENNCFITKDGGSDQTDFDDNYKVLARAIETL